MATVTYTYPVAGLVAPTAAQSSRINRVIADVLIALYDTTITITHNFGFTAAELADGFGLVNLQFGSVNAIQEKPFIASVTANTVVITVTDFGVGSITAPLRVTVSRPASFTV